MKKILLLLCTLGAGLLAGPAAAASAEDELKRFFDGVQSLSANFTQKQTDESGEVLSSTSGRMWLSRPGRFRWSYETPYEQLMVCDGEKIWMYDKDLAQVTVRPAAQALVGTPAALLSQQSSLLDEFSLEDLGVQGKDHVMRLKPKSADSDFKAIELTLQNGTPQRMKFLDQLGGTTEVLFTQVQGNVKIDPALLRFSPPEGAEVIEAEAPQ